MNPDNEQPLYKHAFDEPQRQGVYRAIQERRDVRHFLPDPVSEDVMTRIIDAGRCAPSVGYMQPWRFIRIKDERLRQQIASLAEAERGHTAQALGPRGEEFLKLKTDGIKECAEVIVVLLCEGRERYIFGRRTLPEMDLASAACAIQNMWLAARAEGIGLGWVSLFDPSALRELVHAPDDTLPMAVLCIGQVAAFEPRPLLESAGWDEKRCENEVVSVDGW